MGYRCFDASRLRQVRRERGWSLRALAGRAGLHPATLSMIETRQSPCRERSARAIAMALDLPLDELTAPYRLPPRGWVRRQRSVVGAAADAGSDLSRRGAAGGPARVPADDGWSHDRRGRATSGGGSQPVSEEVAAAAWHSNSPLVRGVFVDWQPDGPLKIGRRFVEEHCPNCIEALPDHTVGLFCCEWCRQIAETVRYWRRVVRDDRIVRPDVRLALRTRLAHLLTGGYPKTARRLPAQTRQQVLERDNGHCCNCGAFGSEIDHIRDSSSQLDNLQLLCTACHQAKTESQMVPASAEQRQLLGLVQDLRVVPKLPVLLCDDQHDWAGLERQLRRERRQRLIAERRLAM